MKLSAHLNWNPAVPLILLILVCIQSQARGFPVFAIVCLGIVAFWLIVCIYRVIFRYSKRVANFPPLSEEDLKRSIGRERMEECLAGKIGFVWISDMISRFGYPIGMMFRDESADKTLSGWTFVSGHEDDWRFGSDLELHDPHAILRVDPAVADYLNRPPGVVLTRQPDGTFMEVEAEQDAG